MADLLLTLDAPFLGFSGGAGSATTEGTGMPFSLTGEGGGGLNVATIALLLGLYFVFMKKKNKMIGYGLIGFWAWQTGMLANIAGTGSV